METIIKLSDRYRGIIFFFFSFSSFPARRCFELVTRSLTFHAPSRFTLVLQIVLAQRGSSNENKCMCIIVYLFWYLLKGKINLNYKRYNFRLRSYFNVNIVVTYDYNVKLFLRSPENNILYESKNVYFIVSFN